MATFTTSILFNAPQQRVWEVITDFENAAERVQAIKKLEILTPGVVGKGMRFRETRIMFKKEATEEMEISEWVPPKRYVTEAESCGCHYRCTFACTSEGSGTRVEVTMEAKPLSLPAKIMSAIMTNLMAGSIRKAFEKDLNDLKRVAEAGT